MKPILLLILEYPNHNSMCFPLLREMGHWEEPKSLIDAGLASLLTGVSVDGHGVLSRWELRPDGQHLREAPYHRLQCRPLWARVPGAVAIGLPWSSGGRLDGTVVTVDFSRSDGPAGCVPLPDRTWPPRLAAELRSLRIAPEELDATTLAELGFLPCTNEALQEIASSLSLHMIGTEILAEASSPLAIVKLSLPISVSSPEKSDQFVRAMVDRYLEIYADGECLLLMRHEYNQQIHYRALTNNATTKADSSLDMGKYLASRLGLAIQPTFLDTGYWERVRAAYTAPRATLPGTAKQIQRLQDEVNCALDAIISGK